jgi:hypothetical protein
VDYQWQVTELLSGFESSMSRGEKPVALILQEMAGLLFIPMERPALD